MSLIEKIKDLQDYKNIVFEAHLTTGIEQYDKGFSAHKKKTEKILKDLKNKYKSWLSEEKLTKLAKTPNYIKQVTLEAKIDILNEIERKLCQ